MQVPIQSALIVFDPPGNIFIVMQLHEWVQLTPEQLAQLEQWELSPDPTVRFINPYYTWSRWQILHDYYTEVQHCEDYEQMCDARQTLDRSLSKLRDDYAKDLDLFIELKISMFEVFTLHPAQRA